MASKTDRKSISSYFKSIRNSQKRLYASLYFDHVTRGTADPDVRLFDMRNWSAQDVRIRINAIVESW